MRKLFCVRESFPRMHVTLLADPTPAREIQLWLHFPKGRLYQGNRIRTDKEAEGYS